MSQSVKHLPYKHKDLGRSQNSHKKVTGSSGEHIESKCWRDKDRWIPGVPQSPGLACLWSSRFSKRLSEKQGRLCARNNIQSCPLTTTCTHTHKHSHSHTPQITSVHIHMQNGLFSTFRSQSRTFYHLGICWAGWWWR